MTESRHPLWEPYTAYVADMSYFSGKMEAYLRYTGIPYERRLVSRRTMIDEVLPATGLMKVPVLRRADGRWLKDTTPMIDWFEAHYPSPPVIPEDPVLRFISKLIEDYADEWCWRAALYWRWAPVESRKALMKRIGNEVVHDYPAPKWLAGWFYGRRQMLTYLSGDGVDRETEPVVERSYLDLLEAMSSLLSDQPFLLGSHPTIVDVGLFGPMFRHYAQDPTPGRIMQERAPAVYAWVERVWNARAERFSSDLALSDFSHPGWAYFLRDIGESYWPYLLRNARAWAAGTSRFDHEAHGVTYRGLKVVRYRVYCLEVLQKAYLGLGEADRADVDKLLRPYGGLEIIDELDSGLEAEHELPLRPNRRPPSWLKRIELAWLGTPWDMPGKPEEREKA